MPTRIERARGVLWGQAVGDALGTTFEFAEEWHIATREPSEWPRELIGQGPFHLLPGQVTDDTELALALARSIARNARYDEDDAAASYVRWRRSNPFDCGAATHQAFGGEEAPRAALLRERASRKTQANGSLMRCSPLGIFGAGMRREELAKLAAADSTLSHPDPVCQDACAVFVTTIADAVETGDPGPVLYERAVAFAKEHAPSTLETLVAAGRELPISDGENQGWVRLAVQHAFFHLVHSTHFETSLVQTVIKGGDTDTNGAIAGALVGAALSEAAIPQRWRNTVGACRSPRPPEYHCSDLNELAESLLHAAR